MSGPLIKVYWIGQTRDGKSEHYILGISELQWTGVGEFNSDEHYIYYCGQESFRRNGVAFMVNKRVWNTVLGCTLKNDRMISVRFQSKQFNITVIQVYAPTRMLKMLKLNSSMKIYKSLWTTRLHKMVDLKDLHSSSPSRTLKLQLAAEHPSTG